MTRANAPRAVLLTGASGYLGGLIATSLLLEEKCRIVAPVRPGRSPEDVLGQVRAEIAMAGRELSPELLERVRVVELPETDAMDRLTPAVREWGVEEIIHCAGCLDYFDQDALEAVNVGLTRSLTEAGRRWGVGRFLYVSTAFSSGYRDEPVREELHPDPPSDPTDYTRSKRRAERVVASCGLPYLILRPSIVIGDSRDGHYAGKQYGLYQLWSGIERLLCREWHPELHMLAPRQLVYLVHQDAFQRAFLAAYRWLPDDSIFNIVSRPDTAPDMRELWELWVRSCLRPRRVYYYERMADVPLKSLPTRQRALLGLASVNLEIASHPWRFETGALSSLEERGLEFQDVSLATVALCQQVFIQESRAIRDYLALNQASLAEETEVLDVEGRGTPAR